MISDLAVYMHSVYCSFLNDRLSDGDRTALLLLFDCVFTVEQSTGSELKI